MTWGLLLVLLGLLLLIAEVFIPSYGMLSVLSIVAFVVGITMIFRAPESEGGGTTAGLLTLIAMFILIPIITFLGLRLWPRTPMGKRLMLHEPTEDTSMASLPEYRELEQLKGQIGKTVTPHRPSGVTLLQGRDVDTKTEGIFLEAGEWVRVIDVRAGQVTVRPLSEDELLQLPDELTT